MHAAVGGQHSYVGLCATGVRLLSPVLFDFKLAQLWDFCATMPESSPFSTIQEFASLRNDEAPR